MTGKVATLLLFICIMDLFALLALCLWWSAQKEDR